MRSMDFVPGVHRWRVEELTYSGVLSMPRLGVAPQQAILALADMVACRPEVGALFLCFRHELVH